VLEARDGENVPNTGSDDGGGPAGSGGIAPIPTDRDCDGPARYVDDNDGLAAASWCVGGMYGEEVDDE
jgi:hypothetical protein